jgi:hypothetical protein
MINLFSQAFDRLNSLIKKYRIQNFLSVVLTVTILLSSGVNYATNGKSSAKHIDDKVFESNSERPTTTREWYNEANKTEDQPVERIKEIGKESKAALKEWGSLYPDTAKRTLPDD